MFERGAFSPYHATLNMSWKKFYLYLISAYVFANFIFTGLYILAGHNAFPEITNVDFGGRFGEIFYFSIQAITTLGSSPIHPATVLRRAFSHSKLSRACSVSPLAPVLFSRGFQIPPSNIIFSESARHRAISTAAPRSCSAS